jgi:hypothetical protein
LLHISCDLAVVNGRVGQPVKELAPCEQRDARHAAVESGVVSRHSRHVSLLATRQQFIP